MKVLHCPMNGPRNINEFQSFGPVRQSPDPDSCSDQAWASYLFQADNRPDVVVEWWRHVPSNYFFLAERHIVSNDIVRTYDPSDAEVNA